MKDDDVVPPAGVVDQGELKQGTEDKPLTGSSPHIDGLRVRNWRKLG